MICSINTDSYVVFQRLERFCTAWEFSQAEETTKASTGQMKAMEDEMQGMENKIAELEKEKKDKMAEIKMLQQSKDAEMGGEVCVRYILHENMKRYVYYSMMQCNLI